MSGPKISAVELERMRKREEEHRNLLQSIYRLRPRLLQQEESAFQLGKVIQPIIEQDKAGTYSKGIQAIKSSVRKISQNVDENKTSFVKLEKESNEFLSSFLDRINGIISENQELLKLVENDSSEIRNNYIEDILDRYRISQPNDSLPTATAKTRSINNTMQTIKSEADRLLSSINSLQARAQIVKVGTSEIETIREHLNTSILDTDRDPAMIYQELHRIDLFEFRPLRKRIEKLEKEADELDAKLSVELSKYHTLCSELGKKPKQFKFDKASIDAIRYETGRILNEQKTNKADISVMMQRVRQTLSDYGYEFLGEKCESLQAYRELYRIHDSIVLHVVYDTEGRITMEVAIEDDYDREPSPPEAEMIVQEQESFCDAFEDIFALINANGLALRKEHMFPCSRDFAEIINVAEFERKEEYNAMYDLYRDYHLKYLEEDAV